MNFNILTKCMSEDNKVYKNHSGQMHGQKFEGRGLRKPHISSCLCFGFININYFE